LRASLGGRADKIKNTRHGNLIKRVGVHVEIFIYAPRRESGVLSRREALRIIMIWMHLKFYSLSFTNNSSSASAPMRFSSLSLGGCWNLFRKLEIMVDLQRV
jgi:hypothetical protein